MNNKEFFIAVMKMRKAQKHYFELRKTSANKNEVQEALRLSKFMESQVDGEITKTEEYCRINHINLL